MKKIGKLSLLLAVSVLTVIVVVGCSKKKEDSVDSSTEENKLVVNEDGPVISVAPNVAPADITLKDGEAEKWYLNGDTSKEYIELTKIEDGAEKIMKVAFYDANGKLLNENDGMQDKELHLVSVEDDKDGAGFDLFFVDENNCYDKATDKMYSRITE